MGLPNFFQPCPMCRALELDFRAKEPTFHACILRMNRIIVHTNCRDLCVSSMHKCRAFILPGPVAHASSTVNAHTAVAIVLFLHWYVPCPRKSDTSEVTIMSFNRVLPFWRASRPRISPPRYPEAASSLHPPAGVGYRQILLLHQ